MLFPLQRQDGTVEILDDEWGFAEMASYHRIGDFLPYQGLVRRETYIDPQPRRGCAAGRHRTAAPRLGDAAHHCDAPRYVVDFQLSAALLLIASS
ncbi:hypothetical protein [Tardiphaga sp.]|uniref:hypothetical protein n=1 Tax=Tardiphaga sp. TaxID=1926292 RepID=UPI0037DA2B42